MNIQIRWTKGTGPGGQHKNKVETCCVMTDLDTGITVKVDGRSRTSNEKEARKREEKGPTRRQDQRNG